MVNSFIFTGLILLAGLAGGLIGSACGKRRNAPEVEARIAELEERLDALADHAMEEAKKHKARLMSLEDSMDAFQTHCLEQEQAIHAQLDDHDLLIGETPDEGLLGRVGALEEARRKEGPKLLDLEACVDAQGDRLEVLEGRFDTFEGGASLELQGLRDAVQKLEAKNG